MTPELIKYYENRLAMTSSDGWRDLMSDLSEMIKSTDTLSGVLDERSLHFKRGELSIMRWLESLAEVSSKTYEELQIENT